MTAPQECLTCLLIIWDKQKGTSRQFISEKMEPLEKMSVSLLMTQYHFSTIQIVMVLNVVGVKRDERKVASRVETISVTCKVEGCVLDSLLLPLVPRSILFCPGRSPGSLTLTEHRWGSLASGFQSASANGRHQQEIGRQGLAGVVFLSRRP